MLHPTPFRPNHNGFRCGRQGTHSQCGRLQCRPLQNVISIDPFTVKKTEVIFGPGSVIYGSDAIGGVMNFYTKDAVFNNGSDTKVTRNAESRFASTNTENTVHFGVHLGKRKWAFLTSASYSCLL